MHEQGDPIEVAFARLLRRAADGGWTAIAWIGGSRVVREFADRGEAEAWLRSLPPADKTDDPEAAAPAAD